MKEGSRNALVGLFVVGALVMLAVMMVWFGETPSWLRKGEWTLIITGVKDIRGVGEGSPVLLNGVEIGRVTKLDFKDRDRPWAGVIIMAGIKSQYSVPEGARAKVYPGFLGVGSGKIGIVMEEGAMPPLPHDTAVIVGEMAQPFGDIISKEFTDSIETAIDEFGHLAAAARPVAENLARMLEQRTIAQIDAPDAAAGMVANVSTVVERIDEFVAHLNEVVGDERTQEELKGIATDLKGASEALGKLVQLWLTESERLAANLIEGVDNTEERIAHALRTFEDVLGKLDQSAGNLNAMIESTAQGKGTIGLLVKDERLYESAVLTFSRLSELISTIHRVFGKIEEDQYFTIALPSAIGPLKKDFPVSPTSTERR